jgi:hypothetical protein
MVSSKRHPGVNLLPALVWGLVFCAGTLGAEFAGGTGEPNDPYQIATPEQLLALGSSHDLTRKHYVLTASLDLAGLPQSQSIIGFGWFSGTFDGRGHTIRNLRIEGAAMPALFNFIAREAEIRNLGLVEIQVRGTGTAGALASTNLGRVVNCYSTGVVFGSFAVGGLLGRNEGTVIDSYSTAAVTGSIQVGGLVGENSGTVSSCYATGEVTANSTAGGLVGSNWGAITESHFVGAVTALLSEAGGLVGNNFGRITSSFAEATVVGQSWRIGGLAGQNGGLISHCHAIGSVTGQEMVGGLVGYNSSRIAASYCDTTVVSYGRLAGGLAGRNYGSIADCYATGRLEGEDQVGGLVGDNNNKISTSYSGAAVMGYGWDTGGLVGRGSANSSSLVADCYFLDWLDGGGPDNGIGTPLTSAQMKQQASFVGWDFWGTAADGVNDAWFMPTDAYPALVWQTDITGLRRVPEVAGLPLDEARTVLTAAGFGVDGIHHDFHRAVPAGHVICATPYPLAAAGAAISLVVSSDTTYVWTDNAGIGTAAQPYRIETAGQLESLIDHPELWDKHFLLSADLDLTGRTYTKALIAPDMDDIRGNGFQGTTFRGTFDGQGHTIRNLTIHQDTRRDYVGLFGMIAPPGRVQNLHVRDADIIIGGSGSSSYVGVLAGYNAGTVANCSAAGIVDGGKGDGLVGFNAGSLIDCRADVTRI